MAPEIILATLRDLWSRLQLYRFILVGGFNTAFSYGLYASFLSIGFGYKVAYLIAFSTSIIISFKTQGAFVFRNTDSKLLGKYIISWLLIYAGNISVIGFIISLSGNPYLATIIALPFTVLISYVVQKRFVFNRR
jgi:putative flippase GtrA